MKIPVGQSVALGRTFIELKPAVTLTIMRTIQAGWRLAASSPHIHPAAGEVAMTETLRDFMRLALASHRMPWAKTMIVAPGSESRSQPGMLQPDGRTDIPIYLTSVFARLGEHDPHAIIECKRVAANDAGLAREYVVEGIDRFRTGKYSDNHAQGFMIGYVLNGTSQAVVDGINRYLTGQLRDGEHLGPQRSTVAHWRSAHDRGASGSPISLHHAMLVIVQAAGQGL